MSKPASPERPIVVFDLGGVLVDWDPRHLYRKLFPGDEPAMERFLSEVCTPEWNLAQDAGRSWAEATALLRAAHPGEAALIDAYHRRWPEMLAGAIEGTVAILAALRAAGTRLYALTNWSDETFPYALERFSFLEWFDGIVVSGRERRIKPDPALYHVLLDRFGIDPRQAVYVDDNARNVEAATALGLHGVHFTDPQSLERALLGLGFPIAGASARRA